MGTCRSKPNFSPTTYHILPSHPPPCRQARQGVFGPSSGGLMSGICVFLRDPQPVTCVTRLVFFEHFFGSYFLMTFWSPMIPQSVQVGLHVGSFLESCCLIFPSCSGVYLGSELSIVLRAIFDRLWSSLGADLVGFWEPKWSQNWSRIGPKSDHEENPKIIKIQLFL